MSALKTWILFFCAAFLLAACSDGAGTSVRAVEVGQSGADSVIGTSVVVDSNGTVFITDSVVVTDAEWSPYYSSGVFCWSDSCEKSSATSSASVKSSASKTSSSSAKPKSSSSSAKPKSSSSTTKPSSSSAKPSSSSVASSSSAIPPTVKGKEMTDNRDGVKYKIEQIGDITWMAENLRFQPSSGTYCDATIEVTVKKEGPGGGEGPGAQQAEETTTVNVCDYYGMFYTSLSAAEAACPYGWRLPTKDEVVSALTAKKSNWWTLGGRFDLETSGDKYDLKKVEKEGRLWIQTTTDNKNCVQLMNYGGGEGITPDYLNAGDGTRAFNVRCVMDGGN